MWIDNLSAKDVQKKDYRKIMKRQLLTIYNDMLTLALTPTRKTRIMYQSNQNHTQFTRHLKTLLDCGLLETNSDTYQTAQKGIRFIRLMTEIEDLLK